MKEYKSFIIKKVTRLDWVIFDKEENWQGQLNGTKPGSPYKDIAKTLKEAKARIDALEA